MATITRRRTRDGQVRYRVRVRLGRAPLLTATFDRLAEARDWAREAEAGIRAGRSGLGEARRRTVADLVDRYLEEVCPRLSASEQRVRARQLAFWSRELGHLLLIDLTPARIVEARQRLTCGSATANRYLAAFSHAVSIAVSEWEWMEDHPVRRVKRHRESRGRLRLLSEEERDRLLAACRNSDDARLYPLVLLALATGARQGELMRLRWSEVDLVARRALIPQTKSGEPRTVPLVPAAVEAIRSLPRRIGSTDFLFADAAGRVRFPRGPWERALRASGVEEFRFHDLRHAAASYLAMSGAGIRDIQAVLGHKTLAMSGRYSHLTENHLAEVLRRMAERFLPPS